MASRAGWYPAIALAVLFAAASAQVPAPVPTLVGCFSSSQPLVNEGTYKYQSSGHCRVLCLGKNQTVLGLSAGIRCWCGDELPRASSKVPSSRCNSPCQGYDLEDCGGGTNYFTVWLTGLVAAANVPNFQSGSGSSTSSTTSKSAATTKSSPTSAASAKTKSSNSAASAQTGAAATTKHAQSHHSGGGSGLAIGLGVGLGVLALAIMLFLFFCLWRRRKRTGDYARQWTPAPDSEKSSQSKATGTDPVDSPRQMQQTTSYPHVPPRKPVPIAMAPGLMAPGLMAPGIVRPEASRASSDTDPFYTPLEQPSVTYINQSELDALKQAMQNRGMLGREGTSISTISTTDTEPPVLPMPDTSMLSNEGEAQRGQIDSHWNDVFRPSQEGQVNTLYSYAHTVRDPEHNQQPGVLYPSQTEVSDFDFTADGQSRCALAARTSYDPMGERVDGRQEMP